MTWKHSTLLAICVGIHQSFWCFLLFIARAPCTAIWLVKWTSFRYYHKEKNLPIQHVDKWQKTFNSWTELHLWSLATGLFVHQQVDEQAVQLPVIIDAMMVMWHYMWHYYRTYLQHSLLLHNIAYSPGLILGFRPANESRRYLVTSSLIGWAQAWNQPCSVIMINGGKLLRYLPQQTIWTRERPNFKSLKSYINWDNRIWNDT